MKVILLGELKGRGGEGDVIEVATGYAVNYLFPKKIAVSATKGNLKQLEQRKHNIAKRETERLDTADKLMAALEGKTITLGAKVGDEGQLFGSITAQQIAEAVAEKFGAEIDRRKIDIHGQIKTAGEHTVSVSIYRDVKAALTIKVVDENELNKPADEPSAEDAAVDSGAEGAVEATEASEATAGATESFQDAAEAASVAATATDAVEAAKAATEAVVEADEVVVAETAVEATDEAGAELDDAPASKED